MPEAVTRDATFERALVWLRRDLRDYDHAAFHAALARARQVACVFVFDREILDALPARADRRVAFIHASVVELQRALEARGGGLLVRHAQARDEVPRLAAELGVQAVFYNHDDDPDACARDATVEQALRARGIAAFSYKDSVIFERSEVLSGQGRPYSVFTPYRKAWRAALTAQHLMPYPVRAYAGQLLALSTPVPALEALGFAETRLAVPTGMAGGRRLLDDFLERIDFYAERRDFPAQPGTSGLSVHLRFGTVSVRELAAAATAKGGAGAEAWLTEIAWREFYRQLLWHRPDVARGHAFKRAYDALPWPNPPRHFAAWCEARTGYPLVDAAMRQLNETGYMHNRLRMVAASFLTKDLLVDWRWGERYFAEQLIDFDLAANSGGWQWAASVGSDAQPWFRIFNPVTQSQKFDPDGVFIRRWLPVLQQVPARYVHAPWTLPVAEQQRAGVLIGRDYPAPIVDHAAQRARALALFKDVVRD